MVDTELMAAVMADFENGIVADHPLDVDSWDDQTLLLVDAFSRAAIEDTPSTEPGAFVIAGLLQGIWIGYEYARREATS